MTILLFPSPSLERRASASIFLRAPKDSRRKIQKNGHNAQIMVFITCGRASTKPTGQRTVKTPKWNGNFRTDRSDRKKWTTSRGDPQYSGRKNPKYHEMHFHLTSDRNFRNLSFGNFYQSRRYVRMHIFPILLLNYHADFGCKLVCKELCGFFFHRSKLY